MNRSSREAGRPTGTCPNTASEPSGESTSAAFANRTSGATQCHDCAAMISWNTALVRRPCFERRLDEFDVAEFRQGLARGANHLRSGIDGDDRKTPHRETSGRLTRTAADFKNGILWLQSGVGDNIVDESSRIIRTRGPIEARDLIECEALFHGVRRLAGGEYRPVDQFSMCRTMSCDATATARSMAQLLSGSTQGLPCAVV